MATGYEDLSKDDLLKILEGYTTGVHAQIYDLGLKKIAALTKTFNDIKIDVSSDKGDKVFDNLMKFLEKGIKISDELERIQKRIDPEVALRIRREAESISELSIEAIAAKRAGK